MIGSTVRLGFDATAVQKGLGGLGGLFGRMGRQIGVGGLQRVGHQITDLMGRFFMAFPQAQKEMMDWAGNMTDMAAQTGVSIQSLLVMEEALRMTGASAADTSRIMSVFKDNLYEASQGAEAQKNALNRLGFGASDLKHMDIDDAFYAIGKRVSELGPEFEGLEGIMADLFGARMGYKMIRFFKDFDGSMATAKKNVSGFSDVSDRMFAGFDNISDIMGRWANTRRNLMMAFTGGMAGDQGIELAGEGLDLLFDKLNSLAPAMRNFGQQMMKGTMKAIEVLSNQGIITSLGDLFKNLGKSIGEGIVESMQTAPKASKMDMMRAFLSSNTSSDPLLKENQKQTGYLAKIQRDGVTAKFG
jgi:hypothetical protein